jgi:hypothetical protein
MRQFRGPEKERSIGGDSIVEKQKELTQHNRTSFQRHHANREGLSTIK